MTFEEFEIATHCLYKCCLTGVKDLHEYHIRRTMGLQILDDILERANPDFINTPYIIHIIWSIMCCIHHFQLRLRMLASRFVLWTRKRAANKCLETYKNLIKKIQPAVHRIALNSIMILYKEGRLWQMDFQCTNLIIILLREYQMAELGIEDILFTIEITSITNTEDARYLTEVLYSVLRNLRWQKMSLYLMRKFLEITEASIVSSPKDLYDYKPLTYGLQTCLKNITKNLGRKDLVILIFYIIKKLKHKNKLEPQAVTILGNAAVYAAKKYKWRSQHSPLARGPLPLVFGLFETYDPHMTLLALRIWNNLIDRHENISLFVTPQIFFQRCQYNIKIDACLKPDKIFFKRFRHLILDIALRCVQQSQDKLYLEKIYRFIALTAIEIPCGYSASCFVTVAMSMQEYACQMVYENLEKANHLHATVMAIMTLICRIHKAKVFYEYVNTIMERRAELAPHLNPPLKPKYQYAEHHILWNKPELLFEDWEARHGLWKCFRSNKKYKKTGTEKDTSKTYFYDDDPEYQKI